LCEQILDSLQKDDERALDRAQADLQDTLYELNREVRLQYEEEEEDDFFGAIRRTFTGDNKVDEDYSYDPRRPDYQDNYGYPGYPNDSRSSGSSYRDPGKTEPTRDRNSYQDDSRSGGGYQDSRYSQRRDSSRSRNPDFESRGDRYYSSGNRSRNIPYENDWDEDDDQWF
jgi:molecular chaperone DnaK